MSKEYPNECCQCGFCCMTQICPIGMIVYANYIIKDRIDKTISPNAPIPPCPGLLQKTGSNKRDCAIVLAFQESKEIKDIMGVGKGCCIAARAIKGNQVFNFADLDAETKHRVASDTMRDLVRGRLLKIVANN